MREPLLAWYRRARPARSPWRQTRDPYAILVSEVMLQQTQVERVIPRWRRWLERWPTVDALAGASPAEAIVEWQGLGYNRRALSLHRAAAQVAANGWPEDLTELPGVGPYTAAAVGNFAFGSDVLPVDTNVQRVQERTGFEFDPCLRTGPFRPRRDRVPRARPPLRALPARGALPLARLALRAGAQAGRVRRLFPAAQSRGAARRGGRVPAGGRRRARVPGARRPGRATRRSGFAARVAARRPPRRRERAGR